MRSSSAIEKNRHYVQVWNIVTLYDDVLIRTPPSKAATLIVWGDDDRVYPVAGAQKLARHIPRSCDVCPAQAIFSTWKAPTPLRPCTSASVTPAARYCAITGGSYAVTSASNTPNEQGSCTFKGGKACDAGAYFAGRCSR